jgi:hypothetical protein
VSWSWSILSPLTAKEALDVMDRCNRDIEAYLEEHPDDEDAWGSELRGAWGIPDEASVVDAYGEYGLPLSDAVRERLATCRSSISIERPDELVTSPSSSPFCGACSKSSARGWACTMSIPSISRRQRSPR